MKKHFLLASAIFLFTCFNPFGTTVVLGQYTQLTDFTSDDTLTASDPSDDQNLISIGGMLYGMTASSGKYGKGTLFKIKPDGTGFAKLLDFGSIANGSFPSGSLISDGVFLYGMTNSGGTNGVGAIFKIKPDGTGFAKLLDFQGAVTGSSPRGSLISDGVFLYGMTSRGGTSDMGTLFKIKLDGTGFAKLVDFAGSTNGKYPFGSLISDGTFLYGLTLMGGTKNNGILFNIKPDGTGFTKIFEFDGLANGGSPNGSLISDGTFLYGMTREGGANYVGTIFKIKPDGTSFSKLLDFTRAANGAYPKGSLISDGVFLYGMTLVGGTSDFGTLFKIKTDGTEFEKLLNFDGLANGGSPNGSLISDGIFLYGMTSAGGSSNAGSIFKIKPDGLEYGKLFDFHSSTNGKSSTSTLFSDGIFLYGTTNYGGKKNMGTIFKIKPDGSGFTKLYDFTGSANGSLPWSSLISDGIFLYGMTLYGGTNGMGTIFKIKPDGSGFTKLYDFTGSASGRNPYGSLFSDGIYLYGMTSSDGAKHGGTIFRIMPDGTGFVILLDFDDVKTGSSPWSTLISDGTFLYGMTEYGGSNGSGTIFKIKPNGSGFAKLLDFDNSSNGSTPDGSLISDGTFLYGMTLFGGTNNNGTIFKIMPDGTGFAKLLDFENKTNGKNPYGSLISDGTFLYGMTTFGGIDDKGTLFKIKPDGTAFSKLLDFAGETNGSNPYNSLIYDGNYLYGTTFRGGYGNLGTVFKYQIGSTTAVSNVSTITSQLSVYPNPNSGSFTIHSATEGVYALLNELGQTIKIVKLNAENKYTMQVDNLSNGIYYMVDTQNGIPMRQKIVVMN